MSTHRTDTIEQGTTRPGRHIMETADTLRFEACAQFQGSAEDRFVCACGWLEDEHGELAAVRSARRKRRQPTVTLPARRAS